MLTPAMQMKTKMAITGFFLIIFAVLISRAYQDELDDSSSKAVLLEKANMRQPSRPRSVDSSAERFKLLNRTWDDWKNLRAQHRPHESFDDLVGATEAAISGAEHQLGMTFPSDFRHFLKLVNGDPRERSFDYASSLLDLSKIVADTLLHREIGQNNRDKPYGEVPVVGDWWHPSFIQVTDIEGGGLVVCEDSGEVWSWDHDGGIFGRVAFSWTDLLQRMNQHVEINGPPDSDDLWVDPPYIDSFGVDISER